MIRHPVPPTDPAVIKQVQRLVANGAGHEEVFAAMRSAGLWVGESIKVAANVYGWDLVQAKIAVHYSETWADCRADQEALHEVAFQAARELGFEEASDPETGHKTELKEAS